MVILDGASLTLFQIAAVADRFEPVQIAGAAHARVERARTIVDARAKGEAAERRIERLVNPALSGLPAFLTREGGLQSGLMLAHVTAATLPSEMKGLAHPASVDTIPTSANKEDHVSMSMGAALKAEMSLRRARHVVAVEMLCACQALDLFAPLTTSAPLAAVHARVRRDVPALDADRPPAPDIEAIARLIEQDAIVRAAELDVTKI